MKMLSVALGSSIGILIAASPAVGQCGDAYEEDDSIFGDAMIEESETQHRNFCDDSIDWVRFVAYSGRTYRIETTNLGDQTDTFLRVYSHEGNLLASDDNGNGGLASRIIWTAPVTDIYHLQVRQADNSNGVDREYELHLSRPTPTEVSGPATTAPLVFTSRSDLFWEDRSVNHADSFNLYRGSVTGLPLGDSGSCLDTIPTNLYTDLEEPAFGEGWFYLVTGSNDVGEGTMGTNSFGQDRTNASPCP